MKMKTSEAVQEFTEWLANQAKDNKKLPFSSINLIYNAFLLGLRYGQAVRESK